MRNTLQYKRRSSGPPGPWTPADIGAPLWAWYDPNRQGGTDGIAVSEVTDYSGNGRHANQTSAFGFPVYRVDGTTGLGYHDYSGTKLAFADVSLTTTDMAWVTVLTTTSDVVGRALTLFSGSGQDYNQNSSWIVYMAHQNAIWTYRNDHYVYTLSYVSGTDMLITASVTSTSLNINSAGTDYNPSPGVYGSINAVKLLLGWSTEAYRGYIRESVGINGVVDPLIILKTQGYLAHKYGIPLANGHIYQLQPP